MPKKCPKCGNKLEENAKFCPECGKKIPMTENKKESKTKKEEKEFSLSKIFLKNKRKTALAVLAIVCIAVVVGTAVIVISQFDATTTVVEPEIGGRIFTVTIQNDCDSDAEGCYLIVDGIKYPSTDETFVVRSGQAVTKAIIEDDLFAKRAAHEIRLRATVGYEAEATAPDITESAEFVISKSSPLSDDFLIECTSSQ